MSENIPVSDETLREILPDIALSVRQPWAWAIIYGGKDIENRSWRAGNPGLRFRGRICVHAAAGMTRDEYEDAADFMAHLGVACPKPADLLRGGIVGTATVADIVSASESPWFFGPKGLRLADAQPSDFIGVGGQLGFFRWWRDGPRPGPGAPAKWMLSHGEPEPEKPLIDELFGPLQPLSPLDRMMRKAGISPRSNPKVSANG